MDEQTGRRQARVSRRLRQIGRSVVSGLFTVVVGGWFWLNHRPQPPETDESLFQGIRYQRIVQRKPRPVVIHVVTVELDTPGLRFLVTPGDRKKERQLNARTTSAFLREVGAQVAINGDFFYPWHSNSPWDYYPHVGDPVTTNGRACSNGVCYALGPEREKRPSLFIRHDNRALIARKPPNRGWMYNVVSGSPILVEDGEVKPFTGKDLQPRTAVALDRTGKRLFLILVDGRQPRYSEGLTMTELARFIHDQGGWDALNLDGGGSTTLAVSPEPGRVRVLNSTVDNHIPGRERPVANHLAVFAPLLE